jgi:hypothetical protein
MHRRTSLWSAITFALIASPALAAPTQYTLVDLHSPAVGNESSMGTAIGDGQQVGLTGNGQALLWNGTPASVVNLNPPGDGTSQALGVSGGKQVGIVQAPGAENHATVWSGTAASAVDINPAGYDFSVALRIRGDTIVGSANVFGPDNEQVGRAAMWTGPSHTFVSLHPAGFSASEVSDIYGDVQGGHGTLESTGKAHALTWSGSADSVVDLHPADFESSAIGGVWGNQQFGAGFTVGDPDSSHALLWTGSADSVVDLHPAGYTSSQGQDIANGIQVGQGIDAAGQAHALAWSGTADSVVDLNQFLPLGFDGATAFGVDEQGNIIGQASSTETGIGHAVMWVPVTGGEPSPIPLPPGAIAGAPVLSLALLAARRRVMRGI